MVGQYSASMRTWRTSKSRRDSFARKIREETARTNSRYLGMTNPEASKLLKATRHVLVGLNTMVHQWPKPWWNETELWRELVACILGSVVPFETARTRVGHLDSVGVLAEAR